MSRPIESCPRLHFLHDPSLAQLQTLFFSCPGIPFKQEWLVKPDADFESGEVNVGWESESKSLHVLAKMHDSEICSSESGMNVSAYLSGDTFEIFLQPAGEAAYHEIHIGPLGQLLQIRFPGEKEFRQGRGTWKGLPEVFLLNRPLLTRRVWIRPDSEEWVVYTVIPLNPLTMTGSVVPGDQWNLSFCRYNHYLDKRPPVISSTSPFTVPDFHRLSEWRTFILE